MSSYRTLVDHGTSSNLSSTLNNEALAAASPTTLHRMLKYWRNSSGKIPGLRKSESFADYRRHSVGVGGAQNATMPTNRQMVQYQRLESYDESKLTQMSGNNNNTALLIKTKRTSARRRRTRTNKRSILSVDAIGSVDAIREWESVSRIVAHACLSLSSVHSSHTQTSGEWHPQSLRVVEPIAV